MICTRRCKVPVHNEHHGRAVVTLSAPASALIVAAVERADRRTAGGIDEFNAAALRGVQLDVEIAGEQIVDAVGDKRGQPWPSGRTTLDPGARVPVRDVEIGADAGARAGPPRIDSGILDAFRTAQSVAWRLWMEICFALTDDVELLRGLVGLVQIDWGVHRRHRRGAGRSDRGGQRPNSRGHPCRAPRRGGPDPRGRTDRRDACRAQLHYRVADRRPPSCCCVVPACR